MKQVRGIYLPDTDTHFEHHLLSGPLFYGHPSYQLHKLLKCLQFIPPHRRRNAIDVGAHVGLWSLSMTDIFETVTAFEPNDAYWQCWDMNLAGRNAKLRTWGLSDRSQRTKIMDTTENTGMSHIDETNGTRQVYLGRLDDAHHSCWQHPVDFMKLDCEGYEYFALKGAETILRECRPFVLVEQKPGNGSRYGIRDLDGVLYLRELGGRVMFEDHGDYGVQL